MDLIRFCVHGQLYSMKNSKQIVLNRKTGQLFPKKHAKLTAFEQAFAAQVPAEAQKSLEGPVALTCDVYYPDRRQDLDIAAVMDCLQAHNVILNDRQIEEIHAFRHVDKADPRVWIQVREL